MATPSPEGSSSKEPGSRIICSFGDTSVGITFSLTLRQSGCFLRYFTYAPRKRPELPVASKSPRCTLSKRRATLHFCVKKVNSTLPLWGIPTSAMNNPATRKALLDAAGSDAWPSVGGRWKICVFCGAMKGCVLFFGWMKCRVRPARLSTRLKNLGRLARCAAADSPRDVPATFSGETGP
jgi:hypothetical protein